MTTRCRRLASMAAPTRILLSVALAYVAWLVLAFLLQRSILFPRHLAGSAGPLPPGAVVLAVSTAEGPVPAWFMPALTGERARNGRSPLVVAAHGNAETIEGLAEVAEGYRERGFHVLLPEYPGYGDAAGSPSEEAIVGGFERALALALARADVDRNRLLYHGRSVGGGVMLAVSTRIAPAAVVLESSFTSVGAMVPRYVMPRFLVRDPFDNLGAIRQLDAPVLILHGTPDTVIPVDHARALAAAARRGTLVLHDRDHNDPPPEVFWPSIDDFLAREGL